MNNLSALFDSIPPNIDPMPVKKVRKAPSAEEAKAAILSMGDEPEEQAAVDSPISDNGEVWDVSQLTQLAAAKAIAAANIGKFGCVAESGKWFVLNQETALWIPDHDLLIDRWFYEYLSDAKKVAISWLLERDDRGKSLLAAVLRAENNHFVTGAKSLLKALPGVTVRQVQFDADPLLTGLQGGKCIDLRSGNVRDIRPSDYLTKTLGTSCDKTADCYTWLQSVDQWTQGDKELARFLQGWAGYSLSGLTDWQGLLFLYGGGANGKSVFINVVTALLGAYSKALPSESLMMKGNDSGASNDIAGLQGARLVTSSELPEGRVFNENLIKQLTGGDRVTARFLYSEFFQFTPQLKLLISGNHKPIIRGNDHGIWRRINLVPFLAKVENPDPKLTEKLIAELPGILNWALQGWQIYRRQGLKIPEAVKRESVEYRSEMDIVGNWLAQHTTPAPGNKIRASDLYTAFKFWAAENGFHVPNSQSFGRKLEGRVKAARSNGTRFYCDVRLM